jgi:hypothetical protein
MRTPAVERVKKARVRYPGTTAWLLSHASFALALGVIYLIALLLGARF